MINKKQALTVVALLATIIVILHVFREGLNVWHWYQIGFNLESYNPYFGFIAFTGVVLYLTSTALIHKFRGSVHWMYWILGFVGIFYTSFLLYGTLVTYWL